MPLYGTLESILLYAPELSLDEPPSASRISPLEKILTEKVRALSSLLQQIQHEVRGRATLMDYVVYRIDYEYCLTRARLLEVLNWTPGASRSVDQRRSVLERELAVLNVERRKQQVEAWRDVAILQREFRTWLKQYSDLMQRVRLVVPQSERHHQWKFT